MLRLSSKIKPTFTVLLLFLSRQFGLLSVDEQRFVMERDFDEPLLIIGANVLQKIVRRILHVVSV